MTIDRLTRIVWNKYTFFIVIIIIIIKLQIGFYPVAVVLQ
jgi:hypothetical protein